MSSTDRRTDGRTDKVNPVYPPLTSLGGGIITMEGRISTACAISVLKNYIKRNHIFCPKIHSAGHEWTRLSPERSGCDFKNTIFNLVSWSGIFRSSHDNALRWMPRDFTDNKSTLVQVMAWCHQAISQYLSQCWTRSLTTYGVTGPQWVKSPWYPLSLVVHFRPLTEHRPAMWPVSPSFFLTSQTINID